jgi:tRNA(fMet)-specific endonuclease VapC
MYLLDTNIVSYLIKTQDLTLIDQFEQASTSAVIGISSITAAELYYGIKKKNSAKLKASVDLFLSPLTVFNFDAKAALIYGDIRTDLELKGLPIGAHDLLIAAHAISLQAILVTNNMREFERVIGISLENWVG